MASIDPGDNRRAPAHMERVLKADTRPSAELDLAALRRPGAGGGRPGAPATEEV